MVWGQIENGRFQALKKLKIIQQKIRDQHIQRNVSYQIVGEHGREQFPAVLSEGGP